jgi:hypothetical protein
LHRTPRGARGSCRATEEVTKGGSGTLGPRRMCNAMQRTADRRAEIQRELHVCKPEIADSLPATAENAYLTVCGEDQRAPQTSNAKTSLPREAVSKLKCKRYTFCAIETVSRRVEERMWCRLVLHELEASSYKTRVRK